MLIHSQELELYSRSNELLRVQANILNIEIFSMKSFLGLWISFLSLNVKTIFSSHKRNRKLLLSRGESNSFPGCCSQIPWRHRFPQGWWWGNQSMLELNHRHQNPLEEVCAVNNYIKYFKVTYLLRKLRMKSGIN